MKKKYYAVKNGRKTGIFNTWAECEKQVKGYPSASFKSFSNLGDAKCFLEDASNKAEDVSLSEAIAYVDGSYNHKTKEFSYGIVMLHKGTMDFFLKKFDEESLIEMRNVAGEIKGAEEAMKYCINNEVKSIDIYHDYEGIAKWCTGEWKTNKIGTKAYKAYYDSIKDKVKINFIKVLAHSGDEYNEIADKLAKNALDLGPYPSI